jgi:hypothetical protein
MLGRHRSFPAAAVIVTLLWVCLSVPLVAQEAARGWTFIAGAGYATQLDDRGSFSVGASALHARSRTFSLGIEGGYDRHEAFEEGGEVWWNGSNVTGIECPAPCTWQRVTMTNQYVNAAWHLGAVLRYIFAPAGAVVPSAELGLGLYGILSQSATRTQDATTGAAVPELSGEGSSMEAAPGLSAAFGVDVFPGNGRIGLGAVARLRGAALPTSDGLLAVGFASLQARVTLR